MRKLYILTLLFFAFSMLKAQEPQKGANKIIVKNDKTASANFMAVKQVMAENEIEIGFQDKDIYQIRTARIRVSDNAGYSYLIFCKDNKISISGSWSTSFGLNVGGITSVPSDYQIMNYKRGKHLFNLMNEFASKLGTDIIYEGELVKVRPEPKKDDVY